MTDIESMLLNDIPYLNALDSSESAARALHKKYALPDIRYSIYITNKYVRMRSYFDKINKKLKI